MSNESLKECPFGQCDGSGSYAESDAKGEPVQAQCECDGRWTRRATQEIKCKDCGTPLPENKSYDLCDPCGLKRVTGTGTQESQLREAIKKIRMAIAEFSRCGLFNIDNNTCGYTSGSLINHVDAIAMNALSPASEKGEAQ